MNIMEDLKNLSAERSLEIIERSIEQSRRDIERGSWKYMLLWGVSVCVVALANGHIWMHYDVGPASNMIWALMGVVALIDLKMRRSGPRRPVSFLNKNITYVWSAFGYVLGAMGLTLGLLYLLPSPDNSCLLKASSPGAATVVQFPLTCIIVFSMGVAGMITGRMLHNKLAVVCSCLAGGVGSVLSLVFFGPSEMIVLAAVSVLVLIVPAIVMRQRERGE